LWTTATKYKKFPLIATPSSLFNSLALLLPIPLISSIFGIEDAGQYSIASRVLLVPLVLIGASVGDVFHSKIALYSRENAEGAMGLFLQVFGGLLAIGCLPMVLIALYGQRLFVAILGDQWATAGQIAAAISPWILAQFAVNPVSRVVLVYQGQEIKLFYDVAGLASIVGVFWLGSARQWSIVQTCAVLGISQAAVYALYFLLLAAIIRKRCNINLQCEA
jgi:O-antigen/teichoic acid export membrane protein